MKLEKKIFYSRFARRIFGLFVFCALLPITILSALSFHQVTSSLEEQYSRRMQQMAKSVAVSIYDRLLLIETNLEMIASDLNHESPVLDFANNRQGSFYEQWFEGIIYVSSAGEKKKVFKDLGESPLFHNDNRVKNADGKTVVIGHVEENIARIFMVKQLNGRDNGKSFIVAELNVSFLWGIGPFKTIPHQTRMCVIDQFRNVYSSPFKSSDSILRGMGMNEVTGINNRNFVFEYENVEYLANYQPIFMRSRFISPDWVIILSQKKAEIFEPLTYFKQIFPLVILLSVWIIILMSIFYIRKSLVPLEKLKAATERISLRDFSTNLDIQTDDEFSDLAESFNSMASELQKQFNTISTRAKIDRAILSSLDSEQIVKIMLDQIYSFLECDVTAIGLLSGPGPTKELRYYIKYSEDGQIRPGSRSEINHEQIDTLINEGAMSCSKEDGFFSYMELFENSQVKLFDVIPAIVNERLIALIIVGHNEEWSANRDNDLVLLSQLANQMAVGLDNSRLIDELEKVGWGALEAFGRAVDAKSPWTAGHSDRVTNYAMQIAKAINLPEERLVLLHRASFLHDIGKIGIPMTILDKSASLTRDFLTMRPDPHRP